MPLLKKARFRRRYRWGRVPWGGLIRPSRNGSSSAFLRRVNRWGEHAGQLAFEGGLGSCLAFSNIEKMRSTNGLYG